MSTSPSATSGNPLSSSDGKYRVCLAVGSNIGDKFQSIHSALQLLTGLTARDSSTTTIQSTSFLHQTAPMYVTDQPVFWNGAILAETNLPPDELLQQIKDIEEQLGRDQHGVRNGPRPIDLDILFYWTKKMECHSSSSDRVWQDLTWNTTDCQHRELQIPHPRIAERDFVLLPLLELLGPDFRHPLHQQTLGELWETWIQGQDARAPSAPATRVLPLPRRRAICFNTTICMGILNVTPDSFSDGGRWSQSIDQAVDYALAMEQMGAHIIDVGGESTRPGADDVSAAEEMQRTIPVIEAIRKKSDIPISIDTRRALVAATAIRAGADIVNDVSGGTFDPSMLKTVADLSVPIVLMHMRGTPQTMQGMAQYTDVVLEVAASLRERSQTAQAVGINRWLQIADPGIGFAKDTDGNLALLRNLGRIRSNVGNLPLLLGTSRKGFLGRLTGTPNPVDRDWSTVSSCITALCLDDHEKACNIVRVHNVEAMIHATKVMDAIRAAR